MAPAPKEDQRVAVCARGANGECAWDRIQPARRKSRVHECRGHAARPSGDRAPPIKDGNLAPQPPTSSMQSTTRSSPRRTTYADVKGRMAKFGREPDDLMIMPALFPVVGRTRAEAQAKVGSTAGDDRSAGRPGSTVRSAICRPSAGRSGARPRPLRQQASRRRRTHSRRHRPHRISV
jgi:hypothetical protein